MNMFEKNRHFWLEVVALGVVATVWVATRSIWIGISAGLIVLFLPRGLVHVPDNSVRPLFRMGNYWNCIEPGYHVVFWPFILYGDPIDTRYSPVNSEQDSAFSNDRVPFTTRMCFPYRFIPTR